MNLGLLKHLIEKVVKGKVLDDIEYLNADQEEPFMIAQANSEIDDKGFLKRTCHLPKSRRSS